MGEFDGMRVLVTGASRGLGEATARRFAEGGATLLTASRSAPPEDLPGTHFSADLATEEGVASLARRVLDGAGGVDVLVNNAGATTPPSPVLERPDGTWRADWEMNLMSAVRLDRLLAPGMVDRRSGVIVHVSSITSKIPQRGQVAYAASKAALNVYSRNLAVELGDHGVRVLCVLPGFVATPGARIHHQHLADEWGVPLEEAQRRLAQQLNSPMGHPGNPADVAEMIAFLASSRAKWLTGAQFRVDGGIIPVV